MSRTKSADRSRSLRSVLGGVLGRLWGGRTTPRHSPAGRLASRAGLAPVEQLEQRQMLFSISIGPGDIIPGTDVGQVQVNFGYVIPYLVELDDVQPQQDQVIDEDFDDELPNQAQVQNVASGRNFAGSNLRIIHNIDPVSDVQLQDPTGNNTRMFVRVQNGEQFSWRVVGGGNLFEAMRSFEVDVAASGFVGLPTDNMRVSLLYAGDVVEEFTGAGLRALNPNNSGVGRFTFQDIPAVPGSAPDLFDEIRFECINGLNNEGFFLDNIRFTLPSTQFAQLIESRIFGATATLAGPVGTTAQFLDLNGDDMRNTFRLGTPDGGRVPIVDRNSDGMPDFNDGIGRIVLSNTDSRSALTIVHGTIQANTTPDINAEQFFGGFNYFIGEEWAGFYSDFEAAGFGYDINQQGDAIIGLPTGPGGVIIGSPFVRDNSSATLYNPLGVAPGFNMVRSDQGIFVQGGGSIAGVYIHGILHGSSQFGGSVDYINVGYLVGSITVQGDLGSLTVGADAGLWVPDEVGQRSNTVRENKTGGELIVGRTLNEVAIAGRSMLDVTVVGDLNTPQTRPPRDVFRYFEKEGTIALPDGSTEEDLIKSVAGNTVGRGLDMISAAASAPFNRTSQDRGFGLVTFRNDSVTSAEWVGSIATAVQINGQVGATNAINTGTDGNDVYAFAVDGSSPVQLQLQAAIPATTWVRIVDGNGRTVAAAKSQDEILGAVVLNYSPSGPGVYYAVVSSVSNDGGTSVVSNAYVLTIGGMAPVVLGAFRTGAGAGGDKQQDLPASGTLNVLAGNVGSIRIGTGFVGGDGDEASPAAGINSDEDILDDTMSLMGGTYATAGTLYEFLVGADIQSPGQRITTLTVGGDLGQLIVGVAPALGNTPEQGDVGNFNMSVAGRIGLIDVRGAIGIEQDADPDGFSARDSINWTTGTGGGDGSIGLIRVGAHVAGNRLNITTSPNSTIGGFLVSQDIGFDPADGEIGIYTRGEQSDGVTIRMGAGSDLRFFDAPRIDLTNAENALIPIIGSTPIELTDDAGGRVTIRVVGAPAGALLGNIRVLAVDQSQGVAIGRINVNLTGGLRLQVTGQSSSGTRDVISIGRIIVTGSDANSSIGFDGNSEIDVWQIEDVGGAGLLEIVNITPDGDIVAADVGGLTRFELRTGDLGMTQVPVWGPSLIGPFIGIGGTGPRPFDIAGGMDDDWNNEVYRPLDDVVSGIGDGNAYLDDIGSPASPYLNGLIVRGGNVTIVTVGGAVRNVVVIGGTLSNLTANADRITPSGRFDGIVGSVYAGEIGLVDVGDGLARRAQSPIDTPGIFVDDDVTLVQAVLPGSFISGAIVASNSNPGDDPVNFVEGIGTIDVNSQGGDFADAFIAAFELDRYWRSYWYQDDDAAAVGNALLIRGRNADFFRSDLLVLGLQRFEMNGGFFDASRIVAEANAASIEAVGFRNSTRTGGDREFKASEVLIGQSLGVLRTFSKAGDIVDTAIDVLGEITQEVSARTFTRARVDADSRIAFLDAEIDLAGSSVTTGRLDRATIGRNIVTSTISVSGPLVSLTADSMANSRIEVTGPDGRIDTITIRGLINGEISASGPIDTIESTEGDIIARITTTTTRGNVKLIEAARDLDITTDFSGTVTELVAGRHIGNRASPSIILIRGSLDTLDVSSGQLYSDIRIGQNLTGSVLIGRVDNRPGANLLGSGSIVAFGSIATVDVVGDFAGDIISYSGGIGTVRITDGSFLPGNTISAFDGNIAFVQIVRGHLMGDIHADYTLDLVDVVATDDGIFGDIGVNPTLSAGTIYGPNRNQLPPGVGAGTRGPRITAGHVINRIQTSNGSAFGALIAAGRFIGTISIAGDFDNSAAANTFGIVAGDTVANVLITGSATSLQILGGVIGFGADGTLGGVGANADLVKSGRVRNVTINGDATSVKVAAGMVAGADGLYNTADDRHALGVSFVENVTVGGTVTNVTAFADTGRTTASSGIGVGGRNTPVAGGLLNPVLVQRDGNGVPIFSQLGDVLVQASAYSFTLTSGETGTITITGPGTAIWQAANNRLILANTTLATSVTITSTTGTLTNFDVQSNDDASLGLLDIQADLLGDSDIVIDAYIHTARILAMSSATASLTVGNDIQSLEMGAFASGAINAIFVRSIGISNNTGGRFTIFGSEGVNITGAFTGVFSLDRSLRGAFTITGAMDNALFRSGGAVGSISVGSLNRSRLSARDDIGQVTVGGNFTETELMAGVDLGRDGTFGGSGLSADAVTTGSIAGVTVGGNFVTSDIVAGLTRGADGFFGTSDDAASEGRSNIGAVAIGGQASGSNLGSESYRIASTGTLGTITFGGQPGGTTGNLGVAPLPTQPLPIIVNDLQVTSESRVFTARLFFNQAMDSSSLSAAISVFQVRPNAVTIRLVEGLDYSLAYRASDNSLGIVFSRSVTERDLPETAGVPGPGVYRFVADASKLRASIVNARLDGNGDGTPTTGDNYSADDIVGDVGDKTGGASGRFTLTNPQTQQQVPVDAYGPINLDEVLDSNVTPDGLPDANRTFTVRGAIGDHPDHDVNVFRFSGDVDVFSITLQAGQILRLGAVNGAASQQVRRLYDANGTLMGAPTSDAVTLPAAIDLANPARTQAADFLIRDTGTYFLVISSTVPNNTQFTTGGTVPNTGPTSGGIGDYSFTLQVFDDGDTGFAATTDAGDGTALVNAPTAISFAGPNGTFGNADDVTEIIIGSFVFTLDAGVDGIRGTVDDIVNGTNGSGITSTRQLDTTLLGDRLVSTIRSAIGPEGHVGVPGSITADVDIFHLNNRQAIAAGTRMRVTVKLADLGADLGARVDPLLPGFVGDVQLGVFETTGSSSVDDAFLIVSPSDFGPTSGTPNTTFASDGATTYGYDANGDFFVEFDAPGRLDTASPPGSAQPATYAVYLQGVYNTDYVLEVQTLGTSLARAQSVLNIFLETRGGSVDWLEVGRTTNLAAFSTRSLGFSGTINGRPIDEIVLENVIANLTATFAAAGVTVNVSTNPAAFENQEFSTVFLSAANDPINFFSAGIFGISEHVDALNADRRDEAVVFIPTLAPLGYVPSEADVDSLSLSLSAAVGRRVGELIGLRATTNAGGGATVDPMAANSVANTPTGANGAYRFSAANRTLSTRIDSLTDTNFLLGQQSSQRLISYLLAP